MFKVLAGLVVGAVLMDSWRVYQEVGAAGRLQLARARAEVLQERAHRRADHATLAGPAFVDEDGEVWR